VTKRPDHVPDAKDPSRERDGELLDVVDPDGGVVGRVPRDVCHGNPALAHRVVHVIVQNAAGEFFLQKRSRTKQVAPGQWDTAVGGHLRPGETYEQAAAREAAEEIGLRNVSFRHRHDSVWRTDFETEHVRTFQAVAEGPFQLQVGEIEDGRFWTVEELRGAAGTGVLTPNLEEELRRIGVLPRNTPSAGKAPPLG